MDYIFSCTKCGNKVILKSSPSIASVLCGNGCLNHLNPPSPVVMYQSNIPSIEEDLFS